MLGLRTAALRLGGTTLWWSARTVLSSPAAPAAPFKCPMFDFTDPSRIEPGDAPAPPNTSLSASTSTTSPTFVDVPWPSTYVAVAGERPLRRQARSTQSR